jgi:hypothetical protein
MFMKYFFELVGGIYVKPAIYSSPQPILNPTQRRPTLGVLTIFGACLLYEGYIVICSLGQIRHGVAFGNVTPYSSHSTLLSAISGLATPTT